MFGFNKSDEDKNEPIQTPYMQTPYLNINPNYLGGAEEYILPEDASATRSRTQMMFSMVGTSAVLGAGIGGLESLRYSGLQLLKVYFQVLV